MPEPRKAVTIPDKLYFRIGEVSRLARVEPYVLRFWEKEFPMLRPTKAGTGHRMYRRKEVELVLEIRKLLYEEGFTIEGARKKLRMESRQQKLPFQAGDQQKLRKIREDVSDLLSLLSRPVRPVAKSSNDRREG